MEGEYSVGYGGRTVGKVAVIRKGLYFQITCRCHIPENSICRLVVRNGEIQENLGIPVPDGSEFYLRKMIPMKKIAQGNLEFILISKKENISGLFVPLCPEEPFRYISRLKESYLAERNGRIGILVPQEVKQ